MTDKTATIYQTTKYDIFKTLTGNRDLINEHLARLAISILQNNMLEFNPIIVNEDMFIIDGQHRLEIAKNNNLPIYYVIAPDAKIEEVIAFNENNKPWNNSTFINSYAIRGYKAYVWLKEFMIQYGINLTQALMFIYGSDGRWSHAIVRKGEFEVTDTQKETAAKRADVFYGVRPYIKGSGFVPRGFVMELILLIDEGLGKKLVTSLQRKGIQFVPEEKVKNTHQQLRELMEK